jgi:hypothetical protein
MEHWQVLENVPHHHCWLRAIERYSSDPEVARVPEVAQPATIVQSASAANSPRFVFM